MSAADTSALLALSADAPLLLHRRAGMWRVMAGLVDVFAVQLLAGRPAGRRHFLLRLPTGASLAGLDRRPADGEWSLIAVGGLGAQLQAVPADDAAEACEGWISACEEVFRDPEGRWGTVEVAVPGPMRLPAEGALATHGRHVLWAQLQEGRLRAGPLFAGPDEPPLPVTGATPVLALTEVRLRLLTTADLARQALLPPALAAWHGGLLAQVAALVQARQAALNEQLGRSAAETRRILAGGLAQLGGFGTGEAPEAAVGDPDLRAIARVAARLGLTPRASTSPPSGLPPGPQRLDALIEEVGLRARRVILRDQWWRQQNGELVGLRRADAAAVALLPHGKGYRLWDPRSGEETSLTEEVAHSLSPTAWMLYRTLPDTAPKGLGLLRFALTGSGSQRLNLLLASLVAAVLGLGVPLAAGVLVEDVIPASATDQIAMLAVGLAAAALGTAAVGIVRAILLLQLESRLDLNSQPALIDRMLRLPAAFFKRFAAGDLADRALGVQQMRRTLTGSTLTALFGGVMSLVNLSVMLSCSAPLAMAGLMVAVLQAAAAIGLAQVQLRRERALAERRGQAESLVLQCISGIAKLKVTAAAERAFALWANRFGRQREAFMAVQRAKVLQDLVPSLLLPLGSSVLFVIAASLLARTDLPAGPAAAGPQVFGLGAWVTFSAAFGQLTAGLGGIGQALTDLLGLAPIYERASPLLEARPETSQPRETPGLLSGAIEFSGVSFGYNADAPPVLDGLNFSIRPGEFVAIVGPSGCGKSTILRLLLGFEEPWGGEIRYDGRSLATLDNVALRRQVGVVLQNGRVQPGNLIENIGGGRPIPLEEAWRAARLAGMEADIKAMPMGMHTVLTDGGNTLSGGQRQRLMIARALARRPRILLLDEATSALDNKTQQIVTDAVAALGLTRIVIAHRLSTIEMVDRVLVLERGRLVQSGGFHELANSPGLFRELARRQLV